MHAEKGKGGDGGIERSETAICISSEERDSKRSQLSLFPPPQKKEAPSN